MLSCVSSISYINQYWLCCIIYCILEVRSGHNYSAFSSQVWPSLFSHLCTQYLAYMGPYFQPSFMPYLEWGIMLPQVTTLLFECLMLLIKGTQFYCCSLINSSKITVTLLLKTSTNIRARNSQHVVIYRSITMQIALFPGIFQIFKLQKEHAQSRLIL